MFPFLRNLRPGGVNQRTAAKFVIAGVAAVGVGTELIPKTAVQQRGAHWITELAHRFLNIIQEARERTVGRNGSVDRR
jgi:2-keto-3-deoxy-6-phosphogluconate aldolase